MSKKEHQGQLIVISTPPPFRSWEDFHKFYYTSCAPIQNEVRRAFLKVAFTLISPTPLFDYFSRVLSSLPDRSRDYQFNSLTVVSQAMFMAIHVDSGVVKEEGGFRVLPAVSGGWFSQLAPNLWDINKVGVMAKYTEVALRILAFKRILAVTCDSNGIDKHTGSIVVTVQASAPTRKHPYHFKVYSAEKGSKDVSLGSISLERNIYIRIRTAPIPQTLEGASKLLLHLVELDLQKLTTKSSVLIQHNARLQYELVLFCPFPEDLWEDLGEAFSDLHDLYSGKVAIGLRFYYGSLWMLNGRDNDLPDVPDPLMNSFLFKKKFRGKNPFKP